MEENILEKREEAVRLFETYGFVLTSTQKNIFSDYYLYDLSLSEIAENRDISRAAVSDSLNKAIKKLKEMENNLHLISKEDNLLSLIEELRGNDKLTKDEVLDRIMEEI